MSESRTLPGEEELSAIREGVRAVVSKVRRRLLARARRRRRLPARISSRDG